MSDNVVLPAFHPAYDRNSSDLLSGTHRATGNMGPDLEAGTIYGPTDSPPDAHGLGQDPHTSNALAGPTDWETIIPRMLGIADPSTHDALWDSGAFDSASVTYPTYSDTRFDRDLLPTAGEFAPPTTSQSPLPYPPGQMTNAGVGHSRFSVLGGGGMGSQSISEMLYTGRSSPDSWSPALDHDGLVAWPRPRHTPSTSDRSPSLPSDFLEDAPPRRLTRNSLEAGKTTQRSRPIDSAPILIPKLDTPTVSSLPLPVPMRWFKIPQERYTQRRGERYISQQEDIGFSVNGARGFNMESALAQRFRGLDGRDDTVLKDANGPVSCRLLFPGYQVNRAAQIAVRNWKKPPTPIPRSKLAYEIAKRVKQYLDHLATLPVVQSVDARWRVGQGCMKFEKMYLVRVVWVSKGSIQPEIWVDDS